MNLSLINHILFIIGGVVYLKSSEGKIKNPHAFSYVVASYKLMNRKLSKWIAAVMGPLELVAGVSLIFEPTRSLGLICGIGLQLVFIILMLTRLNQVLPLGCGCFGLHGPEKVTWKKISVNIILLLYFIVLLYLL